MREHAENEGEDVRGNSVGEHDGLLLSYVQSLHIPPDPRNEDSEVASSGDKRISARFPIISKGFYIDKPVILTSLRPLQRLVLSPDELLN